MDKENITREFQESVKEHLVRHRSILDVLSKLQQASADLNRAIIKTVTACGCVEIDAQKPEIPGQASLPQLSDYMKSHIVGTPCQTCREAVEVEMGSVMFYLTGLCHILDVNLEDVLKKEKTRIEMLGFFSLT